MRHYRAMMFTVCLLGCAGAWAADAPPPAAPAGAAALAGSAPPAAEARIPFANHGGIWTWQVENDHTVLIQGQNRKWYRATLMSPCFDLPFAEAVGFETNPDGSFDKFGAVTVRGQRCPVVSLVDSAAPEKKGKKRLNPPKPTPAATTR